jgi:hypothetical protein
MTICSNCGAANPGRSPAFQPGFGVCTFRAAGLSKMVAQALACDSPAFHPGFGCIHRSRLKGGCGQNWPPHAEALSLSRRAPILVGLAVLWQIGLAAFGQAQGAAFDPASLAAELRRMEIAVENGRGAEIAAALPAAWNVTTPERRYSIPTETLRVLLAPDPSQRNLSLELARSWLDQLAQNLEGYSGGAANFPSDARVRLDRILARSEFAGVRPPNAWERFQESVRAWIRRMLEKIFAIAGAHPIGSEILFWLAMAAAVGFAGVSLLRFWGRGANLALSAVPLGPLPERSSEQWLTAARAAADSGDLRLAIRCAYWAGISHLQSAALVSKDFALTPREQLRRADPNAVYFGPLSALTASLERFWYARRNAGSDDFRASLQQVEKLGCPLD